MSNKVTVTPISELLAALKSGRPNVINARVRKGPTKLYKGGAYFVNLTYNLSDANTTAGGWFSIRDIPITKTVADPNDVEDTRNENKSTRMNVQTSVSASKELGEALTLLQPQWLALVERLIKDDTINFNGHKIHDLLQLTTSKKKHGKAAVVIDDPIIRLKVDFSTYSAKHPIAFLAGSQKTQIFDYNKPYIEDGKLKYRPATVINPKTKQEELVGESNMHLFLVRGAIIKHGRIDLSSFCVSDGWISLQMCVATLTIEIPTDTGFDDDVIADDDMIASLSLKPADLPGAPKNNSLPSINASEGGSSPSINAPVAEQKETSAEDDVTGDADINKALAEIAI